MSTPSGPDARCPLRLGDSCSLCQPGVTGPQDCGLVYLVMSEPDLRDRLAALRRLRLQPPVPVPATS